MLVLKILSVELLLFLGEMLVSVVGDVGVECRCSRYSRRRLLDADDGLVSVCPSEMADVGRLLLVSVGGLFLGAELEGVSVGGW